MLKNYFKVAFRNLLKHKGFSFINILGLSVGLTCCLLIGLYINEEMSYDRFHENVDETYRFTREFMSQDGTTSLHLSRLAP
ncbi:MAG: ABC transporter permease, partial [Cytophagia bacterium]|nr:ABC transporter permease [Cytophagia bacterium]